MLTQMLVFLILSLMTLLNLKKKLNLLLILEMMMMTLIFLMAEHSQTNGTIIMPLMVMLTILMVVDSVLGMSMLIQNSRNTTNYSLLQKF